MDRFTSLLNDVNSSVISAGIGTVETLFGITYEEKPKFEPYQRSGGTNIEININCPNEREECSECGECELVEDVEEKKPEPLAQETIDLFAEADDFYCPNENDECLDCGDCQDGDREE